MYGAADTAWITGQAQALGFALCGIAPAEKFPELERLAEWLERGYGGEMRYLEDPRRSDPQRVLTGAKSVIVCAIDYNTAQPYSTEVAASADAEEPRGWISRYAWGDDYHEVLLQKLDELIASLHERFSEPFLARAYVDTGPVLERPLGHHAGLGWQGKNTCLIHEEHGSWLFLGVIVTTLELAPSLGAAGMPPPDLCGNCRLCLDACPTGALVEPYVLDARRCISYLTIELRGTIPEELRAPMGQHVFGCDICQDVCPWNRRAPLTSEIRFAPRAFLPGSETQERAADEAPEKVKQMEEVRQASGREREESLFRPRLEWLASLSEEEFQRIFRRSPIRRTKWQGLMRNACIALGNSEVQPGTAAYARIRKALERLAASEDEPVADCANWALTRIQSGG